MKGCSFKHAVESWVVMVVIEAGNMCKSSSKTHCIWKQVTGIEVQQSNLFRPSQGIIFYFYKLLKETQANI
jgi:hypothetical protein